MTSRAEKLLHVEQLTQVIDAGDVHDVVRAVESSRILLENIAAVLEKLGDHNDVVKLLESAKNLYKKSASGGPVVGVVGATGAGKSSIINAILDEKAIVPTSGSRACTAVVTELSWNEDDSEDKKYRAEVVFISAAELETDLRAVFRDLSDVDEEADDLDLESKADMVKVLFPHLEKKDYSRGAEIVDELLDVASVKEVVGTTKHLWAKTADELLEQLQTFVDSKDNSKRSKSKKKAKGKATNSEAPAMAFWPLVKVVRIYTKAAALRTGLRLVDLPGTQDANAARSAVAGRYLEQCSALWIVAPIIRAVDDKMSQELLSKTFKLQLQLDGNFSAVTMICSKTDDISVEEASRDLIRPALARFAQFEGQLDDVKEALEEKRPHLNRLDKADKVVKVKLKRLEHRKQELAEALQQTPADEQNVSLMRKRKDEDSDLTLSDDESFSGDEGDDENVHPTVTTKAEARTELDSLEEQIKELKKTRKSQGRELKVIREDIAHLNENVMKLKGQSLHLCIVSRNEMTKQAVKKVFVRLVKDMDEEGPDEDGDEPMDDTSELRARRDYDELRRNLNVFCVSSKAYLVLNKKLGGNGGAGRTDGFDQQDDTEIPQLRQHAVTLADALRVSSCREFLNEVMLLLRSAALMVATDDKPLKLGIVRKQEELAFIASELDQVEKTIISDLELCERSTLKKITILGEMMTHGAAKAQETSGETLDDWFKKRKDGGRLSYQTFRALCYRKGVFSSSGRDIDLNNELTAPLKAHISRSWEVLFNDKFPGAIDLHASRAVAQLQQLRKTIGARTPLESPNTLINIIVGHEKSLSFTAYFQEYVKEDQKTASRQLSSFIQRRMLSAYKDCLQTDGGQGRYRRMQDIIREHVETNDMFAPAASFVEKKLTKMHATVFKFIREKNMEVLNDIRSKAQALIKGTRFFASVKVPQDELRRLLTKADSFFEGPAVNEVDMKVAHEPEDVEMSNNTISTDTKSVLPQQQMKRCQTG